MLARYLLVFYLPHYARFTAIVTRGFHDDVCSLGFCTPRDKQTFHLLEDKCYHDGKLDAANTHIERARL